MKRARRGVMWALLTGVMRQRLGRRIDAGPDRPRQRQPHGGGRRGQPAAAAGHAAARPDAKEQQRLLERLLLLERLEDAKLLLQQWLNQQPPFTASGAVNGGPATPVAPPLKQPGESWSNCFGCILSSSRAAAADRSGGPAGWTWAEALQRLTTHFAARPEGSAWNSDFCWRICNVSSTNPKQQLISISNSRRNQRKMSTRHRPCDVAPGTG